MLLFKKKKKKVFLKPIYVLNCFRVISDFLKCTEVIWEVKGVPRAASAHSDGHPCRTAAGRRARGLWSPRLRMGPERGVSVLCSRVVAAKERRCLVLVQKPDRLLSKRKNLKKEEASCRVS